MGDVFAGRYELVDPLGEGGVGVVWRVWDRKRQIYCAAKVLRQVDATSLLRFIREQSLRLHHPHVLAPTGWAGEDDKVLFTMPMMRGGSVNTLVGDFGPLPHRLTALLLDQLLAALETIHAEGLVHRDVKPANLLLDATGRARPNLWLGDFGIAAGVDEPRLTRGPYALGTPGYLAPECLRHGWDPDPRADLYSAGMCAVEMVVGLRPDVDTDPPEVLETADLPQTLPRGLKDVVLRLTAASLTARTQGAVDARRALAASGLLEEVSTEELLGEVEVFDQVPALPEGWTEDGPVRGSVEGAPAGPASEQNTDAGSTASAPQAGSAGAAPEQTGPVPVRRFSADPTEADSSLPRQEGSPTQAGGLRPLTSQPAPGGPAEPMGRAQEQPPAGHAGPPTQDERTDVLSARPAPTVPVQHDRPPQAASSQDPAGGSAGQRDAQGAIPAVHQQAAAHQPWHSAVGPAPQQGNSGGRVKSKEGSPVKMFLVSSGLILLGLLLLIFTLWIATG